MEKLRTPQGRVCRWKGFSLEYPHSKQGLQRRVPSQAHLKGLKAASGLGVAGGGGKGDQESGGDISFRSLSPPGTTVRPCKQNCLTSTPTPWRKPKGVPHAVGGWRRCYPVPASNTISCRLPPACTEKLLCLIPESRRVWKARGMREVLRGFQWPLSPRGAPTTPRLHAGG